MIIIVNGTSSSGKTSTCKELQSIMQEMFLHVKMDSFLLMSRSFEEMSLHEDKIIKGFHHSLFSLSNAGNYIIVDNVLVKKKWLKQIVKVLHKEKVLFVGLHLSLIHISEPTRPY